MEQFEVKRIDILLLLLWMEYLNTISTLLRLLYFVNCMTTLFVHLYSRYQ